MKKFIALAAAVTTTAVLLLSATPASAKPCYELDFNGMSSSACTTNTSCDQIDGSCRQSCRISASDSGNIQDTTCQSYPWCQTLAMNGGLPICRTRCGSISDPDHCWSSAACIWVGGQCVGDCTNPTPNPTGPSTNIGYTIWDKAGCEATRHCLWTNRTTGTYNGQSCQPDCSTAGEAAACQQLGSPCSYDTWAGCTVDCSKVSTAKGPKLCQNSPGCAFIWTSWSQAAGTGYCRRACDQISTEALCTTYSTYSGYGTGMDDCMWVNGACFWKCDKMQLVQRDGSGNSGTGTRYNAGKCTSNPVCDVAPGSTSCTYRFCEKMTKDQCLTLGGGRCWVVNNKCVRTCSTMQTWNDYQCQNKFDVSGMSMYQNGGTVGDKTTVAANTMAWLCYKTGAGTQCLDTDCGNLTVMGGDFCDGRAGCQWSNDKTCVPSCNKYTNNVTCKASALSCKWNVITGTIGYCGDAETNCDKIRADFPAVCTGYQYGCTWSYSSKSCNKNCGTYTNQSDCVKNNCKFYNRSRWGSECRQNDCGDHGSDGLRCLADSDCIWDQRACSCAWRCEFRGNNEDDCEAGTTSCKWNKQFNLCGYPSDPLYDFTLKCTDALNAGVIAGIVIGVLVGLVLIIGGILCCVKMCGKKDDGDSSKQFTAGASADPGFMSYQPVTDDSSSAAPTKINSSAAMGGDQQVMSPTGDQQA